MGVTEDSLELQGARLVDQHHRNAAADRVRQSTGVADEFGGILVNEQRVVTLGADENLEQRGIEEHETSLVRRTLSRG